MRIVYVAKHDSGGNDDEGAITDALTKLGHTVERLRESKAHMSHRLDGDFLLFHHMQNLDLLHRARIPKAFWCFDLIEYDDPTLRARCEKRSAWISQATAVADLGFCTDGDWVRKDQTGKLSWLMQGADQRIIGKSEPASGPYSPSSDLLFTGGQRGGRQRESWVLDVQARYGPRFVHHFQGKYREVLAGLIADTKIVLAPDGPVTNHYWSNRVYNVLRFGGFLLHPYASNLFTQYDASELVYYRSRPELFELIEHYLQRPDLRLKIAGAGLARTVRDHTYVNRCAELCRIVKERLKL